MKRITILSLAAAVLCVATGLLGAEELGLSVEMEKAVVLAGKPQTAYLKIGLKGFELARAGRERAPLNLALVLDRSGSMEGDKLERAKEAAIRAVGYLEPRDVLSIVAYESQVRVILPAGRVGDGREAVQAIRSIRSGGSTALFAGVSKGAAELRKYLADGRINRIILLSDGLANVGPDSPGELADLGSALRREGISVTTLGLGLDYNEDLMMRLAQASDGNHAFVREPADLARIFDLEFRDAFEVVAKDVRLKLRCPPGVRPIKALNREAEIRGQELNLELNNVYSLQERYFLVELELPELKPGQRLDVAEVSVTYYNAQSSAQSSLEGRATARASMDQTEVAAARNKDVAEKVALQNAVLKSEEAVQLRDKGELDAAKAVLSKSAAELEALGNELGSETLLQGGRAAAADADLLMDEEVWAEQRKAMRDDQYATKNQQRY
jgi:Ca-activated chloride channel family protein